MSRLTSRRVFITLGAAATILFLILYPGTVMSMLGRDPFSEALEQRRASAFSGVITVWQIDSFPGGTGSRADWLSRRLNALERRYNGVYFDVRAVTAKKALENFDSPADIICCGPGVFYGREDSFMTLPSFPAAHPSLNAACGEYAVPLYFGGYSLIADVSLSFENGIVLPPDTPPSGKKKGVTALAAADDGSCVALAVQGDIRRAPLITDRESLWDGYNYQHTVTAAAVSQRELCRLKAAQARNRARPSSTLPLSGYTDLIQYLCVPVCRDGKKAIVIGDVLEYLLSSAVQKTVGEIGMIAAAADADYDNPELQKLSEALRSADFYAPPVFASDEAFAAARQDAVACLKNGNPDGILSVIKGRFE